MTTPTTESRHADTDTLRFLDIIGKAGEVREVRVPKHNKYGHTASGYFDDPAQLAEAARTWDHKASIYVTVNPVAPSLLARANRRIVVKAEHTSSDNDVVHRHWLLVDIDPVRPSGISSTDEELLSAQWIATELTKFLASEGWPEPIRVMSGNGVHLYYAIDLPNDEQSHRLVTTVLHELDRRFSTDAAHVDTTVGNASRIMALPGTLKMKGDSLPERPHRRVRLESCPDSLEIVTKGQLEALVQAPGSTPSQPGSDRGVRTRGVPGRSLSSMLEVAGIEHREQPPDANGVTWYHLKRCPWHDDGRDFECGVGQRLPDGPYAAHCFHPEGAGKGWRDWRPLLGLGDPLPIREVKEVRGRCAPGYRHTDIGNAERLVELHGDHLRFAPALGWLAWDGRRWKADEAAGERFAKETARSIWLEIPAEEDPEKRNAIAGHARRSEAAPRVRAMLDMARSDRRVAVEADQLDANPMLLNLQNGTLDLKAGELLSHNPVDLITRLSPASFDPAAECPTFHRFLDRVLRGDAALIDFLQRACGYALTGLFGDHVLFVLHGSGRNGKSTLIEILRFILGDYARNVAAETLAKGQRSASGPNEDIARLAGVRLITAAETEEGARLAESLAKRMTGGDTMTARLPYARSSIEFSPYGKIFLSTNHKPVIRGTDEAIWSRIKLMPFTVFIPPDERDRELLDKLRQEASGILNWAIEGLRRYLADGLREPTAVINATNEYRAEMDTLRRFVETRCMLERGAEIQSGEFYQIYAKWTKEDGEPPRSQKHVTLRLREEWGLRKKQRRDANYLVGIRLRGPEEVPVEGVEHVEGDLETSFAKRDMGKVTEPASTPSTPSTPSTQLSGTARPGTACLCPACGERPTVLNAVCFRCAESAKVQHSPARDGRATEGTR